MLEKEIKNTCFKDAVNQFLSNGSTTVLFAKSLDEIQEAFHISEEESKQTHYFWRYLGEIPDLAKDLTRSSEVWINRYKRFITLHIL